MTKAAAIIVAAGSGFRFGGRKQHSILGGQTVLERTLAVFQSHGEIEDIFLVLDDPRAGREMALAFSKISSVVRGGPERHDSVLAGLAKLLEGGRSAGKLVLVHDGVRPLVSHRLISRVVRAAERHGAVCPALPLNDTIKRVEGERILQTEDRAKLVRVQTPQGFSVDILRRAFEKAGQDGIYGTDESTLVERLGHPVRLVEGERRNLKITTPQDLKIAEVLLDD
jgi:2-C-methyl-D-erythritol 4-phosphate cytidylyltransferase